MLSAEFFHSVGIGAAKLTSLAARVRKIKLRFRNSLVNQASEAHRTAATYSDFTSVILVTCTVSPSTVPSTSTMIAIAVSVSFNNADALLLPASSSL